MFNIIQSPSRKNIFLAIILTVLSAWVATELLLYSQNVLYKNDFWSPYKRNFYGMNGEGIESLVDRTKIGGHKLRTYHNRVLSKEALIPEEINFKFVLKKDAFIDIIFNSGDLSFDGIRISTESARDSFQYRSDFTGKYHWRKEHNIRTGDFAYVFGSLYSSDGKLYLKLNGETYPVAGSFDLGKIGFDLSEKAFIWDVEVKTEDGKISAPFEVKENKFSFFLKNLIIIFVLVLLGTFIFKSAKKASAFIFLLFSISFLFDYYYYSRKDFRFSPLEFTFYHPYGNLRFDSESVRFDFFKYWYRSLGGHTPVEDESLRKKLYELGPFRTRHCNEVCTTYGGSKYPFIQPRSENSLRILIWGGSFSAGTALLHLGQSYPDLMFKKLQETFPDKHVELMNTSRGQVDFSNFGFLETDNKHFYPDYILVDAFIFENLGSFEEPMKKLSQYNAEIVLLKPPINTELFDKKTLDLVRTKVYSGLQQHPEYFYFLRVDPLIIRWQKDYGFQYHDGNTTLLKDEVLYGGQLFWDTVHLTPYGHEIWAESLTEKLTDLIKKRAP